MDDEWSADLGMKMLSGQLLDWQIVLKGSEHCGCDDGALDRSCLPLLQMLSPGDIHDIDEYPLPSSEDLLRVIQSQYGIVSTVSPR